MNLPRRIALCAALALGLQIAPQAQAAYPDHPIRLIAPYEPGGGVDLMARMVAKNLSEGLGVSVVVENRPGAGGVIGTQVLVNSPPDGYTLLLASPSPIVVAPYLMDKMSYDPMKDLQPVSLIADASAVLLVKNDSPIHTVKDLLDLAKKEPGKLTFSSSGIGGTGHLAALLLDSMSHIDMLHVPYKGTSPAISAVLSGEVALTFADITAGQAFVKSGQLRAVAVTGSSRTPSMPDVPTVAETVPGYATNVWFGVFAPKGTPKAVVDKINAEVVKFVHKPETTKMLTDQGTQPKGSSPEEMMTFIRAENDRWGPVLKNPAAKK